MSHAVTVAVRCRPLSPKELREQATNVIDMEGEQTTIQDPLGRMQPLPFTFDHSFWSADPSSAKHASQDVVYNQLGTTLLDNAFQGYNACLFAYGQTGSGKTYSMMGYGEDKGVIPRLANELFERSAKIQADSGGSWSFHAEVSYLEIYNEKCRCLLTPHQHAHQQQSGGVDFRIREHPTTGPYVEHLKKIVVSDYADIEKLMDQGNKNRTVAATAMNATSSRSHAIFTVAFVQHKIPAGGGKATDMASRINLVDLAGSERADRTGATGDTLIEGSNINKSLTTLGKVIHALSEGTGKDGKFKTHVPFRDSSLTWLLKENLCGNSKTIMLAALSPAATNYEETVSTLRYADRAKQLRTVAVVNEDPGAKKIRELTAEVERLKALLEASPRTPPPEVLSPLSPHVEYDAMSPRHQLEMVNYLLRQETQSWEEKVEDSAAILEAPGVHVSRTLPSLVNLNEDPLMAECLVYYIQPGEVIVGANPEGLDLHRDILLEGKPILPKHAKITLEGLTPPNADDEPGSPLLAGDVIVTIQPMEESAKLLVNGKFVREPTELVQGDRVIFGDYHIFRFSNPHSQRPLSPRGGGARDTTTDYHKALEERFEAERAAWLAQQPAVVAEDEHRKQLAEKQLKLDIMTRRVKDLEDQAKEAHGLSTLQNTIAKTREMESQANAASPLTSMLQLSGHKASRLPPQQIFRYKIVLLGHQEVGKTSLRKCFQSDPLFFKKLPDVQSTTGIEVQQKAVKVGSDNIQLYISDFAGQEAYHSHTLFLTDRSLFVLVWKISAVEQDFKSKGISTHEETRMLRWIDEIYAKFPKASISICATHLDELRDQSQRSVEFILGKVEQIIRHYLKKIMKVDEEGKPIMPSILGNFAVSCKTRTFIAAGQYKNLSGQKLSALLNVLAWEAHRRCVNDDVFWGSAIPGRHMKLMQDVQDMKRDKDKILLPLGEYVHLAVRDGIENDLELLQVSQLMHSWDVFHMFLRNNTSQNAFFFLNPSFVCRMAGVLFSFAHVLDTPYHLRSIIGGLEYTVTIAEQADMGLLSVGWLRMPLVKVLFRTALAQFLGHEPDEDEFALCVQLLGALELIYLVEVPCEEEDVYVEEAPSHYGRQASPPMDAEGNRKVRTVPRFFCPSLSPFKVPNELRTIAPLLFNRGVHIRFDFNMLPNELWWRLQYKLHRYVHPITVLVPKEEEEMEVILQEACETHNRWKDGMWLSTQYARALVVREGTHSIRLYSAESRPKGSDELLRAVEENISDLLEEYVGLFRKTMVCCPAQTCTGWHCVDELHLLAKDPPGHHPADGPVEKVIDCAVCNDIFPVSAVVVTGTSPLGPHIFPSAVTKNLVDLMEQALETMTVQDVCDFFGVRTERSTLTENASARHFEIDFSGCLDKIIHVTMMHQSLQEAKRREEEAAEGGW